ncbi:peroxidase family 2 domain protein [Ceratobasidium sp. AG-Ba]|nr:peroxidase family 2 domain protein [Ceratobasidium sp. AG-Ba]
MRLALPLALLAVAGPSLAYPSADKHVEGDCPFAKARRQVNMPRATTFDPVRQKIDVSGVHAFKPPKTGDLRGPCPGLNALANHGYLPHNGLVTLADAALASNQVFGMGADIATSLATLGVLLTGNPLTFQFSIGGAPSGAVLPPLLSTPQGLSGSHNKYEEDASPGRGDYYLHNGDASSLELHQNPSDYNLDVLIQHRKQTIAYSTQNNPHFFRGPVTGILLSNGAHTFIPALMSNHSAQAPNGVLPRNVLKSFFAVEGEGNNLTYKVGYERIPENWFRRPIDYGFVNLNLDIVKMATVVPEALSVGGNTGKVNTFTGLDLSNLTGGIYNVQTLLEGNNLVFLLEQAIPDIAKGLLSDITSILNLVTSNLLPQLSTLGCASMKGYDSAALKQFPGTQDGGWL